MGRRLNSDAAPPKVLLEFGGKTLLERHFVALRANGIDRFALTVGHCEAAIRQEVARLGLTEQVRFISNPRYREGSVISLWEQREVLREGRPVVLMDGDVLYGDSMMKRLLSSPSENLILVDHDIEPGDEPVKVCFRNGRIVDFGKKPQRVYDRRGESVGFFRFSARMAAALADACSAYIDRGNWKTEYEDAIRDLIVSHPNRFTAIDISGLPWTEIDFVADVVRAREVILPRLEA